MDNSLRYMQNKGRLLIQRSKEHSDVALSIRENIKPSLIHNLVRIVQVKEDVDSGLEHIWYTKALPEDMTKGECVRVMNKAELVVLGYSKLADRDLARGKA